MALSKTGYKDAARGLTKANIAVDEDGRIVPAGETPAGSKRFSINKVNADNGLADNTEVLNFFLTLANGVQDSLSNQMQVTWDADDSYTPEPEP